MARRKRYNHEYRAWRGKSHKKGGKRVKALKQAQDHVVQLSAYV